MNDEADRALASRLGAAPVDTRELRRRLSVAAEQQGLLDLAYRSVDSPVGPLLLVATERGLVRVAFRSQGHDRVLAELAGRISPRVLPAGSRLDGAAREFEEYFGGARRIFDLPLDLQLAHGFRRQVVEHLRTIDFGRTESYAQVARAAGSPRAFRAVGTACARNPLPVVVPCHRVLPSDGSVGSYVGGPDAKRLLLDLETRPEPVDEDAP